MMPAPLTETVELSVFACVVKHQSYAKAAEELKLTPSGVSRIVTRLEDRLGVRLLQRTTRKLSLTEAGALFHARSAQILVDLVDAESEVQKTALHPRGTLKLSASVFFGRRYLAPLLGELSTRFPELSFDLQLTNRFVDLVEEGIDLAIRIGALADSRLIARRLCTNRRIMVASPDYLAAHGVPEQLSDLSKHECVIFSGWQRPNEWRLIGPNGPITVEVTGRITSNNVDMVTDAAVQGLGITVGPTLSASKLLLSGELVPVLPEYAFEPTAVFAVYPSARQLSTKVRAVVDFLAETLPDPPAWDRELAGRVPGF
jgi:DNA-binding transcriptional LysR family regulator